MRYLTLAEVLDLHRRVIEQAGGGDGVRDLGGVESAVAQPEMTFGGDERYPTIESKATSPCIPLGGYANTARATRSMLPPRIF